MIENGVEFQNDHSEESFKLPVNCLPLTHQVAGHFYGKGKSKLGLLQTNDGLVLKPVQSPPRGEREHNFYKRLFASNDNELNQDEIELKSLLPTYRGSLLHNDIVYIKMDDLAYQIMNPAVIDFKMGRITYDPEASIEKINRQNKKYPPVERIGFQLLGMRVFNQEDSSFAHYDKIFGRSLSEQDLIHGLALYYQFHQIPQIHAIKETIKKFENILAWFEKQTTYHFFSSSLIVVYEANLERLISESSLDFVNNNSNKAANNNTMISSSSSDDQTSNVQVLSEALLSNSVRIIMADFAHVFPAHGKLDENYSFGLINLIKHLKQLLDPEFKFKDIRN